MLHYFCAIFAKWASSTFRLHRAGERLEEKGESCEHAPTRQYLSLVSGLSLPAIALLIESITGASLVAGNSL